MPGGNGTVVNGVVTEGALENAIMFATAMNETAKTIGGAALEQIRDKLQCQEWTGIGLGWLRRFLDRSEWTVDCLNVKIRL